MTYANPQSVLAIGVLFLILGVLVVCLRLWARQGKPGLGLDDWFCVAALILIIGNCAIMIAGSQTNSIGSSAPPHLGAAALTYTSASFTLLKKLELSFNLIQVPALMCLKLSILLFYRRIFRGKAFNIASWGLIGLSALWALAFFIQILAACGTHLSAPFVSLGSIGEYCANPFAGLIAMSVVDVFVDLGILILPMPFIWALQMPVSKKIGLTLTFLIGTAAIACGITRMAIFADILGPALLSSPYIGGGIPSDDSQAIVSSLLFWSMLELGIGIIAICLPSLQLLIQGTSPESLVRSAQNVWRSIAGSSRKGSLGSTEPKEIASMETIHRKATQTQPNDGQQQAPVEASPRYEPKPANGIAVRTDISLTVSDV